MTRHRLNVNGTAHELELPPGTPLLDALRETLGLTGTKEACGRGECGACTVLLDGRPILACVALVDDTVGEITTIEGLAESCRDLRVAFADHGAFQCGYCTPGQIVRASALLAEPLPEEATVREAYVRHAMSGNICRCTGYTGIVDAVLSTATRRAGRAA